MEGGFSCSLCIYLCSCIHSDFSFQYGEPVVGGHLANWWVGFSLAHMGSASFEFAFFHVRVVRKEGYIVPLPRGRKSGVVVTELRRARLG